MSGRRQAATVAILLSLFPLLSVLGCGVVALVTLRKGNQDGFVIMLWTLLPAGLQLAAGDASLLFMVVAIYFSAVMLRQTESWQAALVLITVLGLFTQLSLVLQTNYVAQVNSFMTQMVANGQILQIADADTVRAATPEELTGLLLHFYGAYHVLVFAASLMLGRHWQALLYNPGGFRQEFYSLRIEPRIMAVLLAMIAAGEFGLAPLNSWVPLLCIAPLLCGLALAHDAIARRKMGTPWLVMVYLAALLISPAVIALGFIESFFNLRRRMRPAPIVEAEVEKDTDDSQNKGP